MEGNPAVPVGDEVSLAQRIHAGDRAAEQDLVSTYRLRVFLLANARTRDREAARDLTQDVLIEVLKALREGKIRDSTKLAAFIQGITHNLVNNYIRTRARRLEHELVDLETVGFDPVEDLELAEMQRLVRRELQSFSPTDQLILVLSLVDGHSLIETARRLNMSPEAVRARKSRAVKKITKKFAHLSQK